MLALNACLPIIAGKQLKDNLKDYDVSDMDLLASKSFETLHKKYIVFLQKAKFRQVKTHFADFAIVDLWLYRIFTVICGSIFETSQIQKKSLETLAMNH